LNNDHDSGISYGDDDDNDVNVNNEYNQWHNNKTQNKINKKNNSIKTPYLKLRRTLHSNFTNPPSITQIPSHGPYRVTAVITNFNQHSQSTNSAS
jgi:hypothetical protein